MVDSREKVFIWMVTHFRCITELVIFNEKKKKIVMQMYAPYQCKVVEPT